MKEFSQPSIEFISFTEDDILISTASCPEHNCTNPVGYGTLCGGEGGHSECPFTPGCPNDNPQ